MELSILPFLPSDLTMVSALQPEGWPPILPHFKFYSNSDFCFPLKVEKNGKIIGVGVTIVHGETAWLAHIIVSPENRNQGIGKMITQALVDSLQATSCTTILLIATKQGEPIYRKIGFLVETEYAIFKEGKRSTMPVEKCMPYNQKFEKSILLLDRQVSGENREKLLKTHLEKSQLVIKNDTVAGCFFPTLGEGLILAEDTDAGITLLAQKHLTEIRTALPIDNKSGMNYLVRYGFQEFARGVRMRLGKKLDWQPEKIYSRIGGNLG